MRHGNARRGASRAGFPPPPLAVVVAVGNTEAGYTYDDSTWLAAPLPEDCHNIAWRDIRYGPNGFLACGNHNKLLWSARGDSWVSYDAPGGAGLTNYASCAYSPTLDLYVLFSGGNGAYWTANHPAGPWTSRGTLAITPRTCRWVGDRFIVVGAAGSNRMMQSTVGTTSWTAVAVTNISGQSIYSVARRAATGAIYAGKSNEVSYNAAGDLAAFSDINQSSTGIWSDLIDIGDFVVGHFNSNSVRRVATSGFINSGLPGNATGIMAYSASLGRVYIPSNSGTTHYRSTNNGSTYAGVSRGVALGAAVMCASS